MVTTKITTMIIILIIVELHTAKDNYYFYDKGLLQFYFILSAAVDIFLKQFLLLQ